MSTWNETRREVTRQLASAGIVPAEAEARFMVEEVSGYAGADWLAIDGTTPTDRAVTQSTPFWLRYSVTVSLNSSLPPRLPCFSQRSPGRVVTVRVSPAWIG